MRFAKPVGSESGSTIAPLLDVVLLLLIFFMVTTSFIDRQIPLELPVAAASEPQESDSLVVSIAADGSMNLEGEPISPESLESTLRNASTRNVDLEIRADSEARHGAVVSVLDLAKRTGLVRVGIVVRGGD